jgi:hypothetical protein
MSTAEKEEKYPFCLNSRRWVFILDFNGLPKSCPEYGGTHTSCVGPRCGYHEERTPTPYILRKMEFLKRG